MQRLCVVLRGVDECFYFLAMASVTAAMMMMMPMIARSVSCS